MGLPCFACDAVDCFDYGWGESAFFGFFYFAVSVVDFVDSSSVYFFIKVLRGGFLLDIRECAHEIFLCVHIVFINSFFAASSFLQKFIVLFQIVNRFFLFISIVLCVRSIALAERVFDLSLGVDISKSR